MAVETITIITEMIDRASGKLQKVQEVTQQFNHSARTMTQTTQKLNAETNKLETITKKTTKGLKTFQFEFLSVMFLGMAINRVFSQYVKNALEMTGITELFNETLSLMVFSALEPFLEIFYGLIDAFLNLPEPVQKAIGWFIIIATVLSGVAMWFAILKLGLGGLAQAISGPMMGAIGGLIGAVGLAGIIAIIAVILVILVGMYNAWKTNFMGMKEVISNMVEGIKQMFGGMFDVLKGLVQFFYALFTGDTQKAKQAISLIWQGLKNFIVGLLQALANFIVAVGIGIINVFVNVVKTVWNLFVDFGGKMFQWGLDFVMNIINGILSTGRGIINTILSLFPAWMRNMIESSGTITINIIQSITEVVSRVTKRQHGGSVLGGNPYIVGEAGPELFVPSGGGNIVPNNQLGGSGQIVFSPIYNINVADRHEFEILIKNNNNRLVEDLRRLVND